MKNDLWTNPELFPIAITLTVILVFILALTAFFAYAETAITSASKIKINIILNDPSTTKKEKIQAKRVVKFVSNFNEHITAIVIFVNLLTILSSSLMTLLFGPNALPKNVWWMYIIILIIFSIIVLIFADLLPKMLAKRFPEKGVMKFSWILSVVSLIMKPFTYVLSRMIKENKEGFVTSDVEINAVLAEATSTGVTTTFEQTLIKRTLKIDEMHVDQIMIPKEIVATLPMDITKTKLNNFIEKNNFTRFPMINNNGEVKAIFSSSKYVMDKIKGKTGDVKEYSFNYTKFNIDENPFSVLETLRNKREKMGIIINDEGLYAGVITIEDIIELMVGSIYDEDDIEEDGVYKLNMSSFIIEPKVKIGYLTKNYFKKLKIKPEHKDWTLNKFVNWIAGKKISVNEYYTYKNIIIWVKEDKYDNSKIIFEIDVV